MARNSTVLTKKRRMTILDAAVKILRRWRNPPFSPMGPSDIAEIGLSEGVLRVPRGRNKTYLSQILQSTLYNNAHYSRKPMVRHKGWGQYKAV